VVGGAALGHGFGALSGLEFWTEDFELHEADLRRGAVLVAVHSDDLHDVARRLFAEAGADRVTG